MSAWAAVRLALGIALTCLGTVLLLASIPAAIAAAGIQASVGRSGVVSEPLGTLRAAPGDIAVVVDGVSARLITPNPPEWVEGLLTLAGTDSAAVADDVGQLLLIAAPVTGEAFIGLADVDSVNSYLDGSPYSVAVRQGGEWPTISVPGSARPIAPGDASLWVASASGASPELPAEALDGLTLVLMRSDAATTPEAALRLEYRVPGADVALESAAVSAAAASIGGLLIILLGGALVVGRRIRAQ